MIVSSFSSTNGEGQEFTRVYYGGETVIDTVLQFLKKSNNIIYACVDQTRPSLTIDIVILRKAFLDVKKRGVKLLYVTEITKDNLSYCKQLLTLVDELKHLDGIKGNFYISESGYLAPATFHEKGKPASQIIYSNVKELIEHQRYVFDTFWDKAISAEQRIREIEEEREPDFYEVITDNEKASQILIDLAQSVKKEALFFLPNDKAMLRLDRMGLIDHTIKASQNGATVKIICPLSNGNDHIVKKISERAPQIQVLNGNKSPYGMYIVDNERFLRAELRQPGAEKFSEAIGLVVYSNRRITVDSFKSIFELLWNERTLVEELKRTDSMQREFINIASHEMKTPTQAIMGFSEMLDQYPDRRVEMTEAIKRNAKRLHKLTNDILDVSRIESQNLRLNKEKVNINEKISNVVNDIKNQIHNPDKLQIVFLNLKEPLYVEADKIRLYQVIANLLSNAIKFTKEGTISIKAQLKDNNEIAILVKDPGTGIDNDVMPRLFTKFATRSDVGTGLGLYISKNIIEAHGGRMWAANNPDGKGATFSFSLPLTQK
ncbi:MAG: HAMP domain-containing sensor histidine kinase [Nitrososphaeraceae archaeon]|nr:HAMP domain-containing sensor histidine kinase [Nitrososphaeraceae archaeon]